MYLITFLLGLSGLLTFTSATPTTLHPRTSQSVRSKTNVTCCYETELAWKEAEIATIQELISSINSQNVTATATVEPHSCTWLACGGAYKFENEIIVCNDNDYPVLPNTQYLTTYATDVIDKCKHDDPWPGSHVACGKAFDSEGYWVGIRGNITECFPG